MPVTTRFGNHLAFAAQRVAAPEADADDRALLLDVADTMTDLRAPW